MNQATAATLHHSMALPAAPLKIGSEAHLQRACRMLLDSFNPYKPTILAWPTLSPAALKRLADLPFWDVAVQTEAYASRRVQALADAIMQPLLKEALNLNAFEEGRHKLVIENMLRFYGIPLAPEPDYAAPKDPEWSFIRTGYGECFDSFFAFGLYKMAADSGYFPPELVEVFEPVVHEEGRHILFFVNWVAWRRASLPLPQKILFMAKCAAALAVSALNRLSLAGAAEGKNNQANDNFVAAGGEQLTVNLTPRTLLLTCLAENDRRLSAHDPALLRPTIMPFLAKIALLFLRK